MAPQTRNGKRRKIEQDKTNAEPPADNDGDKSNGALVLMPPNAGPADMIRRPDDGLQGNAIFQVGPLTWWQVGLAYCGFATREFFSWLVALLFLVWLWYAWDDMNKHMARQLIRASVDWAECFNQYERNCMDEPPPALRNFCLVTQKCTRIRPEMRVSGMEAMSEVAWASIPTLMLIACLVCLVQQRFRR